MSGIGHNSGEGPVRRLLDYIALIREAVEFLSPSGSIGGHGDPRMLEPGHETEAIVRAIHKLAGVRSVERIGSLCVESWYGEQREEVIAVAFDYRIAWAAYDAAIKTYPTRHLTLKHGIMLVAEYDNGLHLKAHDGRRNVKA